MNAVVKLETTTRPSVLQAMADRYGMDVNAFEATIRNTVMPNPHTREEFAACMLVANEHQLNPITKEIHFMRTKGGPIQPIVGVDGWVKKCNTHPSFDGMTFKDEFSAASGDKVAKPVSVTCTIHRKDRSHPIMVTEYYAECKRDSVPWNTAPSRMLRHRAMIQCARYAFGFAGIMDHDEFEQWQARERNEPRDITPDELLTPPDLPDEPSEELSDAAGFLAKLREERDLCQSAEDVNELREANADLIARLSDADIARAEDILSIE